MNHDYMNHKWQRFQVRVDDGRFRKSKAIMEAANPKRDPVKWRLPHWVKTEI